MQGPPPEIKRVPQSPQKQLQAQFQQKASQQQSTTTVSQQQQQQQSSTSQMESNTAGE